MFSSLSYIFNQSFFDFILFTYISYTIIAFFATFLFLGYLNFFKIKALKSYVFFFKSLNSNSKRITFILILFFIAIPEKFLLKNSIFNVSIAFILSSIMIYFALFINPLCFYLYFAFLLLHFKNYVFIIIYSNNMYFRKFLLKNIFNDNQLFFDNFFFFFFKKINIFKNFKNRFLYSAGLADLYVLNIHEQEKANQFAKSLTSKHFKQIDKIPSEAEQTSSIEKWSDFYIRYNGTITLFTVLLKKRFLGKDT